MRIGPTRSNLRRGNDTSLQVKCEVLDTWFTFKHLVCDGCEIGGLGLHVTGSLAGSSVGRSPVSIWYVLRKGRQRVKAVQPPKIPRVPPGPMIHVIMRFRRLITRMVGCTREFQGWAANVTERLGLRQLQQRSSINPLTSSCCCPFLPFTVKANILRFAESPSSLRLECFFAFLS